MRSRQKVKKRVEKTLAYIMVLVLLTITMIPVGWALSTSFKPNHEINRKPLTWIPQNPTLENYIEVLGGGSTLAFGGLTGIWNSMVVATTSTLLALILGSMAAYVLARYKFRFSEQLAFWILSTRMFPPAVTVLPIFIFMSELRLIDTKTALIIAYLVFNLPFAVWMMRGFFVEIPAELDECSLVDGCNRFKAFWKIALPLSMPGLVATAVFSFITSWNEFLFALVLTRYDAQTFPVQVAAFKGVKGIMFGQMSALSLVGTVPVVLFALFAQKYLVRGLTYGALKN